MTANDIKIRCHRWGDVCTEAKDGRGLTDKQATTIAEYEAKIQSGKITDKQKAEYERLCNIRDNPKPKEPGETAKTALVKTYNEAVWHRGLSKSNKYTEKGLARENEGLRLFSLVSAAEGNPFAYQKNKERIENEFISGTWDTSDLRNGKITETFDIKCSWESETFLLAQKKDPDKGYVYQGQGYMALTGAEKHTIVYCLVNGLPQHIERAKYFKALEMGIIDTSDFENPEWLEMCQEIEFNHIYDVDRWLKENPNFNLATPIEVLRLHEIPESSRVYRQIIYRDDDMIKDGYEFVKLGREWLDKKFFRFE